MAEKKVVSSGPRPMTVGIVAFLLFVVGVGIAAYFAEKDKRESLTGRYRNAGSAEAPASGEGPVLESGGGLPILVDLGADACEPCRMLEPIRKDLEANYADRFKVIYYDVANDAAAGQKYAVQSIPLLVWLSPDGRELHREVGFMQKAEILRIWKELGYDMGE